MNPAHPYLNPQDTAQLLASLGDDADTQAAWDKEAARRDAQIDAGEVETIPGEVVFAKLYAKLI